MAPPDNPILPGSLQYLGTDDGDVIIGTTSAYRPGVYDPSTFRVRADGAGGYSIHNMAGTLDITVDLSEDDPQLAVDLVEVTRLVLDEHRTRALALRLLPDWDPADV